MVPLAGIILFLYTLGRDRQAAFNALIWSMAGLALALVALVALGLGNIINIGQVRA